MEYRVYVVLKTVSSVSKTEMHSSEFEEIKRSDEIFSINVIMLNRDLMLKAEAPHSFGQMLQIKSNIAGGPTHSIQGSKIPTESLLPGVLYKNEAKQRNPLRLNDVNVLKRIENSFLATVRLFSERCLTIANTAFSVSSLLSTQEPELAQQRGFKSKVRLEN